MRSARLAWCVPALTLLLALAGGASAADKPTVDGKPVDKAEEKKADDKKAEGDLAKMAGAWQPEGEGGAATYTFKGDKLTVEGANRTYQITVTLDEKAKPEKTIDMKIDEAPEDAKGQTSRGIYKFDGEKLIICFRAMGERPEKYEMIGFEQIVLTLNKKK
ncbi:MAG: TIGR03067 domain-containing protein [Isosphaeraceae bacterium]|nr:TIGR03067 domain-containing protein [Isosphaeraceae bacterium]